MAVGEHIRLQEVEVQALDAARLEPLIGPERIARYEAIAEATETLLGGRTVLNINSTAAGGGVAEMLRREAASPRCCRHCWPTVAAPASTPAGL
jgi:hypothetical protein